MPRANGTNTSNGVTAALIYTRVSTVEQGQEGLSLAAQLAECQRYAAAQGWIIDSQQQDMLSGQKDDRPGYQALLARVRELRAQGRPCVVVVAALDRFGRRILERVRSREELKNLGVATHTVREGGVVSDLVANVLASVAQEESDRISLRVRSIWAHATSLGWFKVSRVLPWGYISREATEDERKNGSPKTVLDVDPIAGSYVTELFERYAAGESAGALARWASGLPAAVRGEWHLGRNRRSDEREFSRRGLVFTLRNDVYAAPAPARWPSLVGEQTWQRVQARLDDNRDRPRADSTRFPLSGIARCECGATFRGATYTQARTRYYRCGSKAKAGGTCSASYAAAAVEDQVFDRVATVLEGLASVETAALERAWRKLSQPVGRNDAAQTSKLKARADLASKRIRNATQLFVDGDLTKTAYDDMVKVEQATLEAAKNELDKLQAAQAPATTLPALNTVLAQVGGFSGALRTVDPIRVRNVLALLVVSIAPVRIKRGVYSVEMAWTPTGEALRVLSKTMLEEAA